MTDDQRLLNLMGLAMRAGRLITGEDLTLKAIRQKQATIVIVASDASERTKKMISDKCFHYEIPLSIHFTKSELSQAIGKERTICTTSDNGFGKKFRELLSTNGG